MKLGERVLLRVIDLVTENPNIDILIKDKISKLVMPFINTPEELDLMTISKIEALLGEDIIYVPNKQQIRKLKLERLNKKSNE